MQRNYSNIMLKLKELVKEFSKFPIEELDSSSAGFFQFIYQDIFYRFYIDTYYGMKSRQSGTSTLTAEYQIKYNIVVNSAARGSVTHSKVYVYKDNFLLIEEVPIEFKKLFLYLELD